MHTRKPFFLAIALVLALAPGCSKQSTSPSPVPEGLSISPSDGAVGVRLDAAVTLSFGSAVDRSIVERSFHLLSEAAMTDSMCLVDSSSAIDMTSMMTDSDMMGHMLQTHAVPGTFRWNGDTECVFTPDSGMTPDTRYMIVVEGEMPDMMNGTPMPGHDSTAERRMALHFTTLEASSHDAHH